MLALPIRSMGVEKEVLRNGSGSKPVSGQKVTVHCTGFGKNGDLSKKFWSTKDPGQTPFSFQIGQGKVIKGWDEGVLGMQVGEVARLRRKMVAMRCRHNNDLPLDCIANVLSLTTPKDAPRMSVVNSTFRPVAESDCIWERFLLSNYHDIISRLISIKRLKSLLCKSNKSKKDLYIRLSDCPIVIDSSSPKPPGLGAATTGIYPPALAPCSWSESEEQSKIKAVPRAVSARVLFRMQPIFQPMP